MAGKSDRTYAYLPPFWGHLHSTGPCHESQQARDLWVTNISKIAVKKKKSMAIFAAKAGTASATLSRGFVSFSLKGCLCGQEKQSSMLSCWQGTHSWIAVCAIHPSWGDHGAKEAQTNSVNTQAVVRTPWAGADAPHGSRSSEQRELEVNTAICHLWDVPTGKTKDPRDREAESWWEEGHGQSWRKGRAAWLHSENNICFM